MQTEAVDEGLAVEEVRVVYCRLPACSSPVPPLSPSWEALEAAEDGGPLVEEPGDVELIEEEPRSWAAAFGVFTL